MLNATDPAHRRLLTLPESPSGLLSIRAKALVFHDARSADLLEHVERIARSDASVLVIGETGTGKELIARHLHTQSGRSGPSWLKELSYKRPDELIQYGSFPAFLNIQNSQINEKNPELTKVLGYIPKDRAILTVSNHAQRAGAVGDFLVARGYNVVGAAGSEDYEIEGGKNVSHIKAPPPRAARPASAPGQ